MLNAGLIPATVTISIRADFWSKVLPHLTLHPNMALKEEGQLAWATRKDGPQLRQLLTVQYVSNIYNKYYVAYKLTLAEARNKY